MKNHTKALRAALAVMGCVGAISVATNAMAGEPQSDNAASPAMKVKIDKETGKLRAATQAEDATMQSTEQRQLAVEWWDATVPGSSADGVQTLSDGTQAKRMDVDSLQAFAIRIDENGDAVAEHTAVDSELDTPISETAAEESEREIF